MMGYGVVAKEFRIFPFYQLKAIKLSLQPEHDEWYDARMQEFSKFNTADADWVMLGDSLIEYGSWARLLPNIKIANRGIAGDDTRGVLSRVHLIADMRAPHIMMMLGINDIYDDVHIEDTMKNYRRIIHALRASSETTHIYIISTLYVGADDIRLIPKIKHLNRFLKDLARSLPRVSYIDLNQVLSDQNVLKNIYTSDGIHLNKRGYQAWICELFRMGAIKLAEKPKYCQGSLYAF